MNEEIKPQRIDMAIIFYCYIKKEQIEGLLCFDYNPVWNTWYPFYDDVNKIPILYDFKGKTTEELIKEHNKIMVINLNEKIQLAKKRFFEIFKTNCEIIPLKKNFITYELKFSKSQKVHTFYKFYNFVITKVENPEKLFLSDFNYVILNKNNNYSADNKKIVTNAEKIITDNLNEIKKFKITF